MGPIVLAVSLSASASTSYGYTDGADPATAPVDGATGVPVDARFAVVQDGWWFDDPVLRLEPRDGPPQTLVLECRGCDDDGVDQLWVAEPELWPDTWYTWSLSASRAEDASWTGEFGTGDEPAVPPEVGPVIDLGHPYRISRDWYEVIVGAPAEAVGSLLRIEHPTTWLSDETLVVDHERFEAALVTMGRRGRPICFDVEHIDLAGNVSPETRACAEARGCATSPTGPTAGGLTLAAVLGLARRRRRSTPGRGRRHASPSQGGTSGSQPGG